MILVTSIAVGADHASTLAQVQKYILKKEFATAKGLLAQRLKSDRTAYQLWVALGEVYEAEESYDNALKAYYRASELQTGIKGLAARINRLQSLVRLRSGKPDSQPLQDKDEARQLLIDARYKHSFKDYLEAYQLFIKAVELDRSILARDYGFVNNGLQYFTENANQPGNQFYLGAYNFYSGLYPKSENMLKDYLRDFPEGEHVAIAKKMLDECREIEHQARAAEAAEAAALAAAEAEKARANQQANATETAKVSDDQPFVVSVAEPQFENTQKAPQIMPGENLEIAEARAKANKLLNDYDRESNSSKKYRILWRLGVMRQPFPEVMNRFSSLLAKGNIETIYATLEALDKIGLPGAESCVSDLYRLLSHKDPRISYRAIKSFGKLPMHADKIVPKLFNIYQLEKYEIRKNQVIRTLQAYKEDGVAVLDAMLRAAASANKRPIAKVISILTGLSVEEIIRNS